MRLLAAVLRSLGGQDLPRTYWVLWLGTFINRLGAFVAPFLALYLTRDRGFTVAEAGLVVSLYGLGGVLASPLGGALADRVGRRLTLAGGLWLGSGAMLLLGFSHPPAQIAGAAFLLGLLGEVYRPAVFAAVSDVVPPGDRPRAFGLLFWVVNMAFAIALPLAGLIARQSYQLLFVADAATTFVFGCIVWVLVPETRPAEAHGPATRHGASAAAVMLMPFRDPVFAAFCLPVFAVCLLFFQVQMALPVDLGARGLTPVEFGTVMAVNGVLIVVLQPFVSRAIGRVRRSTAMALAAVLIGLGFALHALSSTVPLAMMAVVVWTLGEVTQAPVGPSIVADLAPPELRGSYQGAFHMMWGLAACIAPAIGGAVLERFGSVPLWASCGVLGVAAGGWHLAIAGARRRRMEALRAERPDLSASID